MRVVLQRVTEASVMVDEIVISTISRGFLILLGIEEADSYEDIKWLVGKITKMRVFEDSQGKMNESLLEQKRELLVVSQFTLHASIKKGNRPSFIKAARPAKAKMLYEQFSKALENATSQSVARGRFGAEMKVALVNDGPVTILVDSKNRE